MAHVRAHENIQPQQAHGARKPDESNNRWTEWEQTFRTTWMKSLGLCGLRPCSCRVQASKEDAWATISTLCPVSRRGKTQAGSNISSGQTMKFTSTGLNNCFQMLQRLCCVSLTSVFAVGQDIFGHLVAPAHVVLVRFGRSQLADWDQRSVRRQTTST